MDLAGQAPGSPSGASWAGACAPACGSTPTSTAPPGSAPRRFAANARRAVGRASAPSSWPPSTTSPAWTPRRPSPPSPWGSTACWRCGRRWGRRCRCWWTATATSTPPGPCASLGAWSRPALLVRGPPAQRPGGLLRVRQSIEQPVAAGRPSSAGAPSGTSSPGAVDVAMPDVKHCGGIQELCAHRRALAEPALRRWPPTTQRPGGPGRHGPRAVLGLPSPSWSTPSARRRREGLVDPPEA